jgi:hypothetical protein
VRNLSIAASFLAVAMALAGCSSGGTAGSSTGSAGSSAASGTAASSAGSGSGSSGSSGSTGRTTGHSGGSTGLTGTATIAGSTAGGTSGSTSSGGTTSGTSGTSSGPSWTCDFDGGPAVGGSCLPECNPGFHCEAGRCALNGGNGPIQVTLRWGQGEDLDLHVTEPGCEVYYGNKLGCGGGKLDLDSNAGCSIDNVDIENVIYTSPDGGTVTPAPGVYTVRVDFYSNCNGTTAVPYEVIVRHNGITDQYCQGFSDLDGGPATADHGGAGSGAFVTTFTYP